MFRKLDNEVWMYRGDAYGLPGRAPVKLGGSEFGVTVSRMAGMGNLTSDAGRAALPDLVFSDTAGGLHAIAPDTGEGFDPDPGFGWTGYRLY